jgi:hypothetical protein
MRRLLPLLLILGGWGYIGAGGALLLAPHWFYQQIGTFPPYNRHYAGDLGAVLLPLGVGLLWAARAPERHRGLILLGAGVSLLHAANHLYEAVVFGHPLWPDLPVYLFGLLLLGGILPSKHVAQS